MGNKGTEKMGEGGGRTHKTHTRAPFEECQEFVYQTCPVRDERGTDDKLCGDENEVCVQNKLLLIYSGKED